MCGCLRSGYLSDEVGSTERREALAEIHRVVLDRQRAELKEDHALLRIHQSMDRTSHLSKDIATCQRCKPIRCWCDESTAHSGVSC